MAELKSPLGKAGLREGLQRLGPVKLRAEVSRLATRVAELEDEVQECRRDQHRLAELIDIVQELLLPLSRRDQAAVDEVLAKYTERLLAFAGGKAPAAHVALPGDTLKSEVAK